MKNTGKTYRWIQVALLFSIGLLFQACVPQRCQPRSQTAFRSVTESQWRLVDTNDPEVSANLDNFNFLIFEFATNFTGQVFRVEFNDQLETPIRTFLWNSFPKDDLLLIKYNATESTNAAGKTVTLPQSTEAYDLDLGATLRISKTCAAQASDCTGLGVWYEFVPFQGIVEPDRECEF